MARAQSLQRYPPVQHANTLVERMESFLLVLHSPTAVAAAAEAEENMACAHSSSAFTAQRQPPPPFCNICMQSPTAVAGGRGGEGHGMCKRLLPYFGGADIRDWFVFLFLRAPRQSPRRRRWRRTWLERSRWRTRSRTAACWPPGESRLEHALHRFCRAPPNACRQDSIVAAGGMWPSGEAAWRARCHPAASASKAPHGPAVPAAVWRARRCSSSAVMVLPRSPRMLRTAVTSKATAVLHQRLGYVQHRFLCPQLCGCRCTGVHAGDTCVVHGAGGGDGRRPVRLAGDAAHARGAGDT